MSWITIFAIALALAMDAFAVAIVVGITLEQVTKRHIFRLAFHFGLFQAMMPVLGWSAGRTIYTYIAAFDHWVAFILLALVGGKMVLESMDKSHAPKTESDPTRGYSLVFFSVATSIDALAVGLSIAMVETSIILPSVIIGLVAATLTIFGMLAGNRIGALRGKKAELIGGLLLIGIGIKVLLTS